MKLQQLSQEQGMLYYDSFYTIGKTHTVCQDYVTQGAKPVPYLVLCDGCSSSAYTDVGARVLALAAGQLIERYPPLSLNYATFGQKLIESAKQVIQQLNLPIESLDATVLTAFVHQETVFISVYGDGAILLKNHQGETNYVEIEFTHNAPYYLSYWLNAERQAAYARYEQKPLILKNSLIQKSAELLNFDTPLQFTFPLAEYAIVGIASDGVTNCIQTQIGARVPLGQLVENFLNFKTYEGEFVKRRLKRALDTLEKQHIIPADDISISCFANIP